MSTWIVYKGLMQRIIGNLMCFNFRNGDIVSEVEQTENATQNICHTKEEQLFIKSFVLNTKTLDFINPKDSQPRCFIRTPSTFIWSSPYYKPWNDFLPVLHRLHKNCLMGTVLVYRFLQSYYVRSSYTHGDNGQRMRHYVCVHWWCLM